jgi:TRAP-type C4-dicarboxylate transport system permease small subunit
MAVSQNKAKAFIDEILRGSAFAGWIVVIVMMLWGTGDVIFQIFGSSLPATYEWTEVLNVIAITIPLAYVARKKSHIIITLFAQRLTGRKKNLANILSLTLVFLFSGLLAWQLIIQACYSVQMWEFDQLTIKVYWFPAKIALALGFTGTAIVVLWQIISEIRYLIHDIRPGDEPSDK